MVLLDLLALALKAPRCYDRSPTVLSRSFGGFPASPVTTL